MKKYIAVAVLMLASLAASAETLYVYVDPRSELSSGDVYQGLQSKGCANVTVTADRSEADFELLANYAGLGIGNLPAGANLSLLDVAQGHIVYGKSTRLIHSAFKDMCKDYFGKKR